MDPNGIRLYVPLRIGIVHRWSRILFDYYGNILLDSCRLRLFAQWNVSAKISSVCVECLYMPLRLPWKLLETRGMGEPFLAGTTSKLSGVRRNLVGKCWKAYIWYSSRFIFLDYTIWQTIWAWIPYTCIIIYTIWCTWFYREIKAQTKENPKMGGLCIWPKSVHQGPIQNDVSVLITCYTKKHASAVWYIKRNYYGIATSQKLGKQFSMILVFFGPSLIQSRMGGGFFYALLWSTARRQPHNRGKGSVPVRARQKQFFLVHASQV